MSTKVLRSKCKKFLQKLKKFLKKVLIIKHTDTGRSKLYIRFPFRVDARLNYGLRHATKPIKPRKIVFDNYMGKGYGCNPKYVAEKLLEKYPGKFEVVWIVSKGDSTRSEIPSWIKKVNYSSSEALREFATAKVWVSNYHKISFVKKGMFKRKGQYFIQMWHGSLGIKKIENDVSCLTVDKNWLRLAKRSSKMVDFWISNSSFEDDVYRRAFWNVRNILRYGHPRNDILLQGSDAALKKVRAHFKLEEQKILLYAPTFREDYRLDCYRIDFEAVQRVLQSKYGGEWVVLVRLHPRVRKYIKKILPRSPGIFDATYYTDIQELVASADCMITDYSSCIFDFMLTRRPGFIFAPDLEEYDKERGFYYPLQSTPFPIARNNEELFSCIARFDGALYRSEVDTFLKDKGCIEDGHASERVADKIAELTGVTEEEETKLRQGKTPEAVLNRLYDKYHMLPIQENKLVCVNFHGKGYGCNPKYIVQELLRRRADLDIVWLVDQEAEFPDGIRTVPYHSEQAIMELATAKVLIDNTMKFIGFKKRPDQFFIQTWHGSIPLKKIGYDNASNLSSKKYKKRVKENFPCTDLVLSNSSFSSDMFRRAFRYTGAILEKGSPRNDILLDTPSEVKERLCKRFQIPMEKKLILHIAAHWSKKNFHLDYSSLLEQMGGEYVVLARLHARIRRTIPASEQVVDVSEYPDLQELMAVSDLLITDDSENIFDFALTGRPAYFFAEDLWEYHNQWCCYFGVEELPFPLSEQAEELLQQLHAADTRTYQTRLARFREKVGLNETGQAAQYAAELIEKLLGMDTAGAAFMLTELAKTEKIDSEEQVYA